MFVYETLHKRNDNFNMGLMAAKDMQCALPKHYPRTLKLGKIIVWVETHLQKKVR